MLTAIYNLIIGPLELFFEILFSVANRVIENPGISIIFLSLAMNFLVLPLYKRADALQEEERETEARLRPWITHIKKTFKGDERFMMLQTYYRQNNYKQTDILKGSVSLLLEIPFFIAAYNFLSGLELLQGVSFGPIRDLGVPDQMLFIGGHAVNVLPILMTLINLVSSAIYTKGLSVKSKVQLYGMAAIFLVLLYQSPAGLVFYWTLNNLFSLVKNVFYKLKNPKKVLAFLASLTGGIGLVYIWMLHPMDSGRRQLFITIFMLALQLPLLLTFMKKRNEKEEKIVITKKDNILFFTGSIFMAVLTGVLIPTAVISSSPEEFINRITHTGPLVYVYHSALTAIGIFVIWSAIFYMLANAAGKKVMEYAMCALCAVSIVDYMFFGKDLGNMSFDLHLNQALSIGAREQMINFVVLCVVCVLVYLIWSWKKEIIKAVLFATVLAGIGMSFMNIRRIDAITSVKTEQLKESKKDKASIPLSTTGKNVMVIMMDRAVSSYVPYIFNEVPEVAEQFKGFTYYPNTISFGAYTNFGVPGVYGGYEYVPEEMNVRKDEKLEDKHNEALKLMPVLFDKSGYETTVCDPTYAGYDWIPDLSIYDEYPDINRYITMGNFEDNEEDIALLSDEKLNRNFFCYSIFKVVPSFCQSIVYNDGEYNATGYDIKKEMDERHRELAEAKEGTESFRHSYHVLQNLNNITKLTDDPKGCFLMMSNDSTHEPSILHEYDYVNENRITVDGRTMKMDNQDQVSHYQINVASYIQLGKWFDFMRMYHVYDNTRIIIVSDHGAALGQFDEMMFGSTVQDDAMLFNPLLLVKDFGSTEFSVDNTFMTNADVPTIAMEGMIENPVNPFTGKPVNSDNKNKPEQHIFFSQEWDVRENNGNTFHPGRWISVHDDIFNMENWDRLDK